MTEPVRHLTVGEEVRREHVSGSGYCMTFSDDVSLCRRYVGSDSDRITSDEDRVTCRYCLDRWARANGRTPPARPRGPTGWMPYPWETCEACGGTPEVWGHANYIRQSAAVRCSCGRTGQVYIPDDESIEIEWNG